MKRFPLLFLAAGLVSCAPLPPLVTDPPEDAQTAESSSSFLAESSSSVTAEADSTVQKPFVAMAPENAEDSIPDSTTTAAFAPIAPAADTTAAEPGASSASLLKDLSVMQLPEALQRDFRVGILVSVSKAEISGNDYIVSTTADSTQGKKKSGSMKVSPSKSDSLWVFPGEGSRLSVNGKEYRGKILVVKNAKKLNVINVLPVEDYLKGVVPHEIGKLDASMFEALKVQAVAARTYAYHHFNSRASLGFDVYATVQDQVYNGSAGEAPLPSAAIDSTVGIVLTYNGNFIEAYYHSTCGGHTEGVEVWGLSPVPYLQSQNDMKNADSAWCESSSYSTWKKAYSEKELVSIFKKNLKESRAVGKSNFSGIQQIEIKSTFPGGRVNELEVLTNKGVFTVKGDRTRWLFQEGSKILPSAKFKIEKNGKVWVIDGSGFGHGIGMCQMGARARAKAGQSFKEILEAYYPGATLQCISSGK